MWGCPRSHGEKPFSFALIQVRTMKGIERTLHSVLGTDPGRSSFLATAPIPVDRPVNSRRERPNIAL